MPTRKEEKHKTGQRIFIVTDMNMNTKRQEQIENLFNYADAVKTKLTPGRQTAESRAGRKVKQ